MSIDPARIPEETMMFGSRSFLPTGYGALLVLGTVLFSKAASLDVESRASARSQIQPMVTVTPSDTTRPIPVKSCSTNADSGNDEEERGGHRDTTDDKITSLHDLTCQWAEANDLRTDPNRLPKYVRPTGDSLRLNQDALVYLVEMVSPFEKREDTYFEDEYFVAEVGDSLFYEGYVSVRDMRGIEVPNTQTRYIWVEYDYNKRDSTENWWRGHIFTYDPQDGIRYAARAPVRMELFKDGKSMGYTQVDVSIPQPGIMKIDWRDIPESDRLPTRLATKSNFHNWIGLHVIDRSETDKREYQKMPTTGSYVVVDSANASAWDRQSEYVMIR